MVLPLEEGVPLLLRRAADGEEAAASVFFKLLPELIWYVPSRSLLEDQEVVEYPNDIYGFLAIKTEEFTIVPIFSDAAFCQEWAGGRSIQCREVTGKHLLETIPEDWWIGINPGQEIEKELSPWEIILLKKDHPEAISELIRELFETPLIRELSTRTPDTTEYLALVNALTSFAEVHPAILELFLLERLAEDVDENQVLELLLGVSLNDAELIDQGKTVQDMQSEIASIADIAQIGGTRIKVFAGVWGTTSIALLSFAESVPFYTREPSLPAHE